MEANRAEKYSIKICRREIIAAEAKSVKECFLSLSNIDLLIPHADVGVFFCYRKPSPLLSPVDNFSSMVAKLKSSLAKALAVFYPFAGEVVLNAAGEPELLCNNRGVEFIEAYADVGLDQLDFYDADGTVERKLVPKKKKKADGGVLTLQVTEMKCGGMILGCSFDHRISDAYTFNMFVIAWAKTAVDAKELSIGPIFDRSLLSPRQANKVGSLEQVLKLDQLYVPVSSYSPQLPLSPPVIQNPDPSTISPKTKLGSYYFPWEGKGGYVMPMPMSGDNGKDGDWLIYVYLSGEIIEVLETVGASVFRPITSDYLFSSQK